MTKAFYLPSNFQKIFERCFVKCNLCKMFRYSAEKADRISHNQSNVLRRIATQWIKTVQKSLILNHKEIIHVISRIFQKRFVAFSRIFQFKMVQKKMRHFWASFAHCCTDNVVSEDIKWATLEFLWLSRTTPRTTALK